MSRQVPRGWDPARAAGLHQMLAVASLVELTQAGHCLWRFTSGADKGLRPHEDQSCVQLACGCHQLLTCCYPMRGCPGGRVRCDIPIVGMDSLRPRWGQPQPEVVQLFRGKGWTVDETLCPTKPSGSYLETCLGSWSWEEGACEHGEVLSCVCVHVCVHAGMCSVCVCV